VQHPGSPIYGVETTVGGITYVAGAPGHYQAGYAESNRNLKKILSILGAITTPVLIGASVMMLYGIYGGALAVDVLNSIFEHIRDILFNAIGRIGSTVLSSVVGVLGVYALLFKALPTIVLWGRGKLVRGTCKQMDSMQEINNSILLRWMYVGAGVGSYKLFNFCNEKMNYDKDEDDRVKSEEGLGYGKF
jgi:hypothetical protein